MMFNFQQSIFPVSGQVDSPASPFSPHCIDGQSDSR